MQLSELIARLETARAGDQSLDWDIAEYLGEIPEHRVIEIGFDYVWCRQAKDRSLTRATDSEGRTIESWSPPTRTTRVEAALTMVPQGWGVTDVHQYNDGFWKASVWCFSRPHVRSESRCVTPNLAMAICLAALKVTP